MDTLILNINGYIWEILGDDVEFIIEVLGEQYQLDKETVSNIIFMYYESQLESLTLDI